jgi:hypothetical protein
VQASSSAHPRARARKKKSSLFLEGKGKGQRKREEMMNLRRNFSNGKLPVVVGYKKEEM